MTTRDLFESRAPNAAPSPAATEASRDEGARRDDPLTNHSAPASTANPVDVLTRSSGEAGVSDPSRDIRPGDDGQRDRIVAYYTPSAEVLAAPVADDAEARLYYHVPPPVDPAAWRPCVTCGGEVAWSLTNSGARLLVERDGMPHARRCEVPV